MDSTRKTDEELKALVKVCDEPIGDEWNYDDDEQVIYAIDRKRKQFLAVDLGSYTGEERWATMRFLLSARESFRDIILDLQASRERERVVNPAYYGYGCSNCGESAVADKLFCPNCGSRLKWSKR